MNLSFKAIKQKLLSPASKAAGIYHDIYDFSYLPFSYGDTITWGVLAAVRCQKANRQGVHVHIVCDVKVSGCSILTNLDHATEMYMLELMPAFSACPLFSGITLHGSRASFDAYWSDLVEHDPLAAKTYAEHQDIYAKRRSYPELLEFFYSKCSRHKEIDDWYAATKKPLHLRPMPECVVDVEALKSNYPAKTFWVAIHCRLLKLDDSLKASRPGTDMTRDGNFVQWYNFIERAGKQFPHVRFVLLGRLQEKPLALLRLTNVVTPRVLGMTMGHEIAMVNQSNLFMGSLSGPAQLAFFSPVEYAMFNCTKDGCKNLGIPFGYPRAPHSGPMQRLYYGTETSELLMNVLSEHMTAASLKTESVGISTTSRYFVSAQQEQRELFTLLRPQIRALLIRFGEADYEADSLAIKQVIRDEFNALEESFPNDIVEIPEYGLMKEMIEIMQMPASTDEARALAKARRDLLLVRLGRATDRRELVRGGKLNLFPHPLTGCFGLDVDGLCEKETTVLLGCSSPGSFLVINWLGTPAGTPVEVEIQVADEKPVRHVLPDSFSQIQILLARGHTRTPVYFRFSEARPWSATDPRIRSALLESMVFVTCEHWLQRSEAGLFRAIPGGSGIRNDGWCSQEAKLSMADTKAGDSVTFHWLTTASGKPVEVEILVAGEEPVRLVLPPEKSSNVVRLTRTHPRTNIAFKFSSAFRLSELDPLVASARLDAVMIEQA